MFLTDLATGVMGAVTGGITGMVGSAFGLPAEAASNAMSKEDAKELMKYQFDLQQKGIDRQNAYNTPLAQMERLRDAQLNPNLVYGSGSVVGNTSNAASTSQAKPRSAELEKYAQMASQLDFSRAQQDLQLSKASEYETYKRAEMYGAQKALLEKEAEGQENQNAWWTITIPTRTQIFTNKLELSALQNDMIRFNMDVVKKRLANETALNDKQIEMFDRNWEMMMKRFDLDKQKLGAMIRHWVNQDANASQFAKAAIMNAIFFGKDVETRRLNYNLAKSKFDKFSDEQLGLLITRNLSMKNAIKWQDILGEDRSFLMQMQGSGQAIKNYNSNVQDSEKMMYQFMNNMISDGFDFGDDLNW